MHKVTTEVRIKNMKRTQQNLGLTNPNLSAKVHEETKQRVEITHYDIENTSKNSRTILLLLKRRWYVMIIILMFCVFLFFVCHLGGYFCPLHEWTD